MENSEVMMFIERKPIHKHFHKQTMALHKTHISISNIDWQQHLLIAIVRGVNPVRFVAVLPTKYFYC